MPSHDLPPLKVSGSELSQSLYDELRTAIRGRIIRPSDTDFDERSKIFNGNIIPRGLLITCPLDAQDVSSIVKFCVKHSLSPSVKAGGYAIAGWAVAGDVVIDLGMLRECEIELPLGDEEKESLGGRDWVSLKDVAPMGSKGKSKIGSKSSANVARTDHGRVQSHNDTMTDAGTGTRKKTPEVSSSPGLKRRRADSEGPSGDNTNASSDNLPKVAATQERRNLLGSYDGASASVASFLQGSPLPLEEGGEEPRKPPTNRRRVSSPEPKSAVVSSAGQDVSTFVRDSETQGGRSTRSTDSTISTASPAHAPEPFGYISRSPEHAQARLPMFSTANPFMTTASASALLPASSHTHSPSIQRSAGPSTASASSSHSLGSMHSVPLHLGMSLGPTSFASPMGILPSAFGGSLGGIGMGIPVAPPRPVHTHAYVTWGAGMRQKEVDLYTAAHPLEGYSGVTGERTEGIVPYHVPTSAHPVGSSILLLSGFGFISRMHGLSIDNLVEVEMVLADGRIVVVNVEEDPEMWWAIRGAGPAFGIATRYKVRAYPVPVVFAGNLVYRFHRATAPSLIKHFRDCIKNAPRELYANVLLTAGPADKDSLVVIQICYAGPKEQGIEYLNAISSWDGERCLLNEVKEKSYINQQDSVAQILRGKPGRQWFIRSSLIHSLPDEVVNKTVIQFADTPIGCTWIFELAGGAIADFEDTCLPKEQREAIWTVAALHQWEMGIDDPRCIESAEKWIDGTIGSVALGGPFPSNLGRHEPPARTMACYGKNWARLAELKQKYDPDCLFKNNFWPVDKDGKPIELLTNEPPSPSE